MPPVLLFVKQVYLPDGYGVHILLDVARMLETDAKYLVAVSVDRQIRSSSGPYPWDVAEDVFEAYAEAPGPRGDTGWRAVLDRLMGKAKERAGQWQGSIAEYASRFAPIGSYAWVTALIAYRKNQEERAMRAAT